MPLGLYDTHVLTQIMERTKPDPRYFLQYFPNQMLHESETILADEMDIDELEVTPYALPRQEARLASQKGYSTKMFRPAYLKEKIEIDAEASSLRLAGDAIGGSMSSMQREKIIIAQETKRLKERIERRKEQMAAEVLTTGMLNIKIDRNRANTIDFNRNPDHSGKVKDSELWSKANFDIAGWIEDKAQMVFDNSGSSPTQLVFGRNVWNYFRKNKTVKEHLELRRAVDVGFEVTPKAAIEGMRNIGTYGDFQMLSHVGQYKDPFDGQVKNYVPENSVMFLSPGVQGTKHYGKIKDRKAKMKAMRYFVKTVEMEDPSALFLIAQSAPLLVPGRIDATACIQVV